MASILMSSVSFCGSPMFQRSSMLGRKIFKANSWLDSSICLFCAASSRTSLRNSRTFTTTKRLFENTEPSKPVKAARKATTGSANPLRKGRSSKLSPPRVVKPRKILSGRRARADVDVLEPAGATRQGRILNEESEGRLKNGTNTEDDPPRGMSLKEALLAGQDVANPDSKPRRKSRKKEHTPEEQLAIEVLYPQDLYFEPIEVEKPPVPMLAYGLDRVLFNPGVYCLQDARSRVYNFDPYLEKIMPAQEFNFDALSEYKTSSKDQDLLDLTKRLGTKYTGSTSSMSSVLQQFHYLLSDFRALNHDMLSRQFPEPSPKFSKITLGPSAIFLRKKDEIYAIDADKSFDSPNIMSWLGHSLEKLLTTERSEFERFRRSNQDEVPTESDADRCYHYSRQGDILMRSQLDAHDPRLPGTGVFDLKTRAVVSIRMDHTQYEEGTGYQLRYSHGEWESFEREFYDMTRATLLKYSLQVRMGRMDGIFLAFHNIERIFGFQYLALPEMDRVLHGQVDTCLGDQEFRFSLGLLQELLNRAVAKFPNTSVRFHFETRPVRTPFMYIFAEPVTEEEADDIQSSGEAAQKEFARTVIGVGKDDPEMQAAWQDIQKEVDEHVDEDKVPQSIGAQAPGETSQHIDRQENQSVTTEEYNEEQQERTSEKEAQVVALDGSRARENGVDAHETNADPLGLEAAISDMESILDNTDATPMEGSDEEPTLISDDMVSVEETDLLSEKVEIPKVNSGPLMGWTLTIRNKVNGAYVKRPERLSSDDTWNLEYHIKDIAEEDRWHLYNGVRERRRALIGQDEKEVDKGLEIYRNLIHRYSRKGREWRTEQDAIDEVQGTQTYRPLGPGSVDKEDQSMASTKSA